MNGFLRFTKTKIFLTAGLVLWQLVSNFQRIAYFDLSVLADYLRDGLSFVNWDNYFLRKFSFLLLWILVAILIFAVVYVYELVSTYCFNKKVEKKFTNQPKEDYEHLLKKMGGDFWERFYPKLYRIAGIVLIIFTLFYLPAIVENIRLGIMNLLLADLEEGNQSFNPYLLLLLSFGVVLPLWYLISSSLVWINQRGKIKEEEEAVAEKHFAVKVEEVVTEEESEG